MSRALLIAMFAGVLAGCAPLAFGQHVQLINESVRLYGQGRFVEAIATAENALKRAEAAVGPEHPDVATALNNLAEFRQVAAIVAKDEPALRKAIADAEPLHRRALAALIASLRRSRPSSEASLACTRMPAPCPGGTCRCSRDGLHHCGVRRRPAVSPETPAGQDCPAIGDTRHPV
jgi:hypothetical protein